MSKTKLQKRLERFSSDEFAPITTKALARIIAERLGSGESAEDISGEMGTGWHYLYTITSQGSEMLFSTLSRHCKELGYSVRLTVTRDSDGRSWEYQYRDDEI